MKSFKEVGVISMNMPAGEILKIVFGYDRERPVGGVGVAEGGCDVIMLFGGSWRCCFVHAGALERAPVRKTVLTQPV